MHLTGFEPALLSEMEPKSIAYTGFAIGAYYEILKNKSTVVTLTKSIAYTSFAIGAYYASHLPFRFLYLFVNKNTKINAFILYHFFFNLSMISKKYFHKYKNGAVEGSLSPAPFIFYKLRIHQSSILKRN